MFFNSEIILYIIFIFFLLIVIISKICSQKCYNYLFKQFKKEYQFKTKDEKIQQILFKKFLSLIKIEINK